MMPELKIEYDVEGPNSKGFYCVRKIERFGLNRAVMLQSEHRTEVEAMARAEQLRAAQQS